MKAAIIGAGKVGTAFAVELSKCGYNITSITDTTISKARKTAEACKCKTVLKKFSREAAENSDLIVISVKDDDLSKFYSGVMHISFKGKILIHTSGVHTSEVFRNYDVFMKDAASFHPAQTFPEILYSRSRYLRNIYFAAEGGARALKLLKSLTVKLNSGMVVISKKNKPLFHLSCVVSSNFLAANFYMLKEFSATLGVSERKLLEILKPLFSAASENILKGGVIGNLTGPVARGDIKTLASHIDLLHRKFPKFLEYYKSVSRILTTVSAKQNRKFDKTGIQRLLDK